MFSIAQQDGPEYQTERVRLLYRLCGRDLVPLCFIALILAFALLGHASERLLIAWLAWIALVSIARKLLSAWYARSNPPPEEAKAWEDRFCAASALLGAVWGGMSLFLFFDKAQTYELTMVAIVGSLAMGSPGTLSPSPKAFACFIMTIFAPLVALLLLNSGGLNTTAGIMLLLISSVLLSLYLSSHRALLEVLRFSRENEELNAKVREAELSLIEARQRLNLAVQASHISAWEWDSGRGTMYLDPAWRSIVGGEVQESYLTLDEFNRQVHPEDAAAVERAQNAMLRGLNDEYRIEYRVRTTTGEWRWILSRGRAIERDERRYASIATGTNVDTTVRKQAEAELQTALKQERVQTESKVKLLAVAAQEMRIPLASILSSADMLDQHLDVLGMESRRELLQRINQNAQHLRSLIDDVLTPRR